MQDELDIEGLDRVAQKSGEETGAQDRLELALHGLLGDLSLEFLEKTVVHPVSKKVPQDVCGGPGEEVHFLLLNDLAHFEVVQGVDHQRGCGGAQTSGEIVQDFLHCKFNFQILNKFQEIVKNQRKSLGTLDMMFLNSSTVLSCWASLSMSL